jgi:Spy/CpxP family protein refolding chaperone
MKIENIKGMIRVCMILLLSAFTAFAAKAQVGKDNPAQNTTMSKAPAVSSQNAAALRAALRSPEQLVKQIITNTRLSPIQKQQQLAALAAKRHRAIDSLLTPEQKMELLQGAAAARQASYRQTGSDTSRTNN